MDLLCTKCEKTNKCDCKSTDPDGKETDSLIILEDEKFNQQDSLDFEWDRMHQKFKENITPEMALTWKSLSINKERKEYVNKYTYGEYGFESAFFQHFNIRHNECSGEELLILDRDNKIKSILDE
jgi:hypothetical protein